MRAALVSTSRAKHHQFCLPGRFAFPEVVPVAGVAWPPSHAFRDKHSLGCGFWVPSARPNLCQAQTDGFSDPRAELILTHSVASLTRGLQLKSCISRSTLARHCACTLTHSFLSETVPQHHAHTAVVTWAQAASRVAAVRAGRWRCGPQALSPRPRAPCLPQ